MRTASTLEEGSSSSTDSYVTAPLSQTDNPTPEDQTDGPAEVNQVVEKMDSYRKMVKEILDWLRIVFVVGVAAVLILGVIYNFFASNEKDIPEEVFSKLYKFMIAQGAGALPVPDSGITRKISEWPIQNLSSINN